MANDEGILLHFDEKWMHTKYIKKYTVFRFFVGNSNDIQIKIYDISGKLIDEISNDDNLIKNEFNEMVWNIQGLEPGLYLAEIKSDLNEFKLLKIIIN